MSLERQLSHGSRRYAPNQDPSSPAAHPHALPSTEPRAPLWKRVFKVGKLGAVFASGSALFSDGYVNNVSSQTNTIIKVCLVRTPPSPTHTTHRPPAACADHLPSSHSGLPLSR